MNIIASINLLDVIVVLLLIFFSYRGYTSGFINILFDSLAIIVSFYAANKYSIPLKEWLGTNLKFMVSWSGFASYILVYLASFVFFVIWGRLITKIFQISPVGIFNSIAGLVLNFFKWSLLVFIAIVVVDNITIAPIGEYLSHSFVYNSLKVASSWPFIKEFVPAINRI